MGPCTRSGASASKFRGHKLRACQRCVHASLTDPHFPRADIFENAFRGTLTFSWHVLFAAPSGRRRKMFAVEINFLKRLQNSFALQTFSKLFQTCISQSATAITYSFYSSFSFPIFPMSTSWNPADPSCTPHRLPSNLSDSRLPENRRPVCATVYMTRKSEACLCFSLHYSKPSGMFPRVSFWELKRLFESYDPFPSCHRGHTNLSLSDATGGIGQFKCARTETTSRNFFKWWSDVGSHGKRRDSESGNVAPSMRSKIRKTWPECKA